MPKRLKLRPLTAEEAAEIRRLASLPIKNGPIVSHARVILEQLEHPELTANAAGMKLGLSNNRGLHWVKRFNKYGVAGLQNIPRGKGVSWFTDEDHQALVDLALQPPITFGYSKEYWTMKLLQEVYEKRCGKKLNQLTIRRWLENAGYPWNRQVDWHNAEALKIPKPPKPKNRKMTGITAQAFKRLSSGTKYCELTEEEHSAILAYQRERIAAKLNAANDEECENYYGGQREYSRKFRAKKRALSKI